MKIFAAILTPLRSSRDLKLALDALTRANVNILRSNRSFPPLYASGVRYSRENALARKGLRQFERWQTVPIAYKTKLADCEDLACWRAAELILQGERARAIPIRNSLGWHIVVRRGNGRIEDPSRRLGM